MSQKHILFISSWYPTRLQPTNGDFVQRHAQAVATKAKVALIHVAFDPNLTTTQEIVEIQERGFTEIICYFKPRWMFSKFKILIHILTYLRLIKKYQNENGKIDITHINVIYPAVIIGYILKITKGIPYVLTEHWTAFLNSSNHGLSSFQKRFIKFFSKKNSAILPVSQDLQNALQALGIQGDYTIINNVVDTAIFKPDKKTDATIKILHVSHLRDDHKNISGIIRGIKSLSQHRQDFILQVASEDSGEQLTQLVSEHQLEQYVDFLGFKNHRELAQLMSQASFLLLFSNYENFPCVIVESLASGTPVLSSKVGGIHEHLTRDKGILVEARNENELLEALITMCDNFTNYDSKALSKYATEKFSQDAVSNKFIEVYNRILNG